MITFTQDLNGIAIAKAIAAAHAGVAEEQGSQTSFFRAAVKNKTSRAHLCEGLRILAERPEQRQSKNAEAGPFYMARTILGSVKRMTDPKSGKCAGAFKIDTRKCEKDADKRLLTAPVLVAKDAKPEGEDAEVTAKDARDSLLKWAKSKGIAFVGALAENDAIVLQTSISDLHAEMAKAILDAEAKAQVGEANEGEAVKKAA